MGGCSWYPKIRLFMGTPVAAAKRAVWPGDACCGLREICSSVAETAAMSALVSRVVMKRSRLSAPKRFYKLLNLCQEILGGLKKNSLTTAGVDLDRLTSCLGGGT